MRDIDKIFEGLKNTCYTSLYFKDGDYTQIKPEYLFTSLIAKEFSDPKSNYVIKLEEPTSDFATNCVPQKNDNFKFSTPKNVCRNGKIDIAVYTNENDSRYLNELKSLFPIEIKGVNPQKNKFLEDIQRNIEYFSLEDEQTGPSVIDRAYNCAVEIPNRFLYKEELEKFKKAVKEKYENWLKPYDEIIKKLGLEIFVETKAVMENLYSENDNVDKSEGDTEWEFFYDWHLYIGVVVSIIKNE